MINRSSAQKPLSLISRTFEPDPRLQRAVLRTVVYSDIFDYPLTPDEIHRYLVGVPASREAVHALLEGDALVPEHLSRRAGYVTLTGREAIVDVRRERSRQAADLWVTALRYGRILSSFPFVRMVAVTGELAMDNVGPTSDIDYFIITEHRRLWLCRGFALLLVRAAATAGVALCPNYLLSERALALQTRDLYAAHEIAQMIPISGLDTYARFRQSNRWMLDELPNAVGAPRERRAMPHARPLRALAESALRTPLGGAVDRWERERKVRKLSRNAPTGGEAAFAADWCKGHYHNHGRLILEAFEERTRRVEGLAP